MSEIPENAVENFKAEWHRADAEGDVGNRVARGLGAAVGEELRRLRRELEGVRAGIEALRDKAARLGLDEAAEGANDLLAGSSEQPGEVKPGPGHAALDLLGPDESRDPDAAPMSGEEVRWRPAPVVPDSPDVREVRTADGRVLTPPQVAALDGIKARTAWASMHWRVEDVHPDAWPHLAIAAADAVLAVVGEGVTAESKVAQVNRLLGVSLWDAPSFRADVRIDFHEDGSIYGATLLNPAVVRPSGQEGS